MRSSSNADVALEGAEAELAAARAELDRIAESLSERRRAAAPQLAAGVRERLAELAMADAEFEVAVRPRDGGCGPTGADVVEFMIAPNPGLPDGPLKEIASGGELSRVMLALMSAADGGSGRARSTTLVFDEVDAGIGGHTARAVGEQLRALAEGRQVLCITHLPQIAALGRPTSRSSRTRSAPPPARRSRARGRRRRRRARPDARRRRRRPRRAHATPANCSKPPNRSTLSCRIDPLAFPSGATRSAAWDVIRNVLVAGYECVTDDVLGGRYRESSTTPRFGMARDPRRAATTPAGETRFIFVTGGVVSSLGKGIAAASIGRLLVARAA